MLLFLTKHPDHVEKISLLAQGPFATPAAQPLALDLGQLPCMPNMAELACFHMHLDLWDAAVTGSVQLTQLASVQTVKLMVCSVERRAGVLRLLAQLPALETLQVGYAYM